MAPEHILKKYPRMGFTLLRVLYRFNLTFCILDSGHETQTRVFCEDAPATRRSERCLLWFVSAFFLVNRFVDHVSVIAVDYLFADFQPFLMKNQPVEKLPFPNNIILLFSRLFLSQFVIVNRWKFPKTSCKTEHWISVHLFLHMLEVQDDQDTLLLSIERKNYMIRRNVILNSIFSTICSIWVASLFSFPR